jgi:PEP-CTERM motif
MKLRVASLTILCLALAVVPAGAGVLYENGPINGETDAWPFNSPYVVSDSFTLSSNSTVGGFDAGLWEFPGDVLSSVDWSITSSYNGGTLFGSGTVSGKNLTDTFLSTNTYGYDINEITATGLNVNLTSGTTYWLNLTNAITPKGNPTYWDENSGVGCQSNGCPSQAVEALIGTIPSESFTINGTQGGTTPEPGSFLLFGSGILGVVGLLRRRLL